MDEDTLGRSLVETDAELIERLVSSDAKLPRASSRRMQTLLGILRSPGHTAREYAVLTSRPLDEVSTDISGLKSCGLLFVSADKGHHRVSLHPDISAKRRRFFARTVPKVQEPVMSDLSSALLQLAEDLDKAEKTLYDAKVAFATRVAEGEDKIETLRSEIAATRTAARVMERLRSPEPLRLLAEE